MSVYTAVHVVPVDPSVGARSGAGKTIPPFRFEDHVLLEFRANKNPRCYAFQHPLSRHPTWMLSIAPAPITIPKPLLACRCESEDKSKKEDIKRIVRGEGSFQKTTRNDLKLSDPIELRTVQSVREYWRRLSPCQGSKHDKLVIQTKNTKLS